MSATGTVVLPSSDATIRHVPPRRLAWEKSLRRATYACLLVVAVTFPALFRLDEPVISHFVIDTIVLLAAGAVLVGVACTALGWALRVSLIPSAFRKTIGGVPLKADDSIRDQH